MTRWLTAAADTAARRTTLSLARSNVAPPNEGEEQRRERNDCARLSADAASAADERSAVPFFCARERGRVIIITIAGTFAILVIYTFLVHFLKSAQKARTSR